MMLMHTPLVLWALSSKERNRLIHALNGNSSATADPLLLNGNECLLLPAFLEVGLEMIALNYISLDDQLAWRLTCRTLRASIRTVSTGGFVTTTAVAAIAKGSSGLVFWALADVLCPPDRLCLQLSACGRVQELDFAVDNYYRWSASPSCAQHLYACIRAAADHSWWGVLEWALRKGHIALSTEGQRLYDMLVSNDMFDESLSIIVQLVRSPFVLSTDLDASSMYASGERSRLYMVLQALRALPPTYEAWHGISASVAPDAGYEEADVIDYFFALGCTDMLGQDATCTRVDVADALECLAGLGYAQSIVGFYNNTYGSFLAPRVSPGGTVAGPSASEQERLVGYYLIGDGLKELERDHPPQEQLTAFDLGASCDEALASMILPFASPGASEEQAQQPAQQQAQPQVSDGALAAALTLVSLPTDGASAPALPSFGMPPLAMASPSLGWARVPSGGKVFRPCQCECRPSYPCRRPAQRGRDLCAYCPEQRWRACECACLWEIADASADGEDVCLSCQ